MRLKFFITFLLIAFYSFAFSQKLLDTGKVWNIMECMIPGACLTNTWQLANRDTLVDNHTYKIIEQTDSMWGLFHSDMVFMREDSAKRVYCYTNYGEVKMYDFNLQVGDTFRFDNPLIYQYSLVDAVDSITLLNGEKRKHISFGAGYEDWIEGIGSTHGLFDAFMDVFILDMSANLLCFKENGVQKYEDPNYQNCFYSSVGIQENKTAFNFQISPNPSSSNCELSFNLTQADCLTIKLIELSGKSIKTIAASNFQEGAHKIKLDVSALESGIYFIQIQGQKFTAIQKLAIVKE